MEIKKIYSDKKYCLNELLSARKIFTDNNLFTKETAESLSKGLGLMYLYCPDEIQDLVLSNINELTMREFYIK